MLPDPTVDRAADPTDAPAERNALERTGDRRSAMWKIVAGTGFAAPAMMVLLDPRRASATVESGGAPDCDVNPSSCLGGGD
jgi:hypothetical protein